MVKKFSVERRSEFVKRCSVERRSEFMKSHCLFVQFVTITTSRE